MTHTRDPLTDLRGCTSDWIFLLGQQQWSPLDSYEYDSGYPPTFSVIAWDRETFARTPKPIAVWSARAGPLSGYSRGKPLRLKLWLPGPRT